MPTNDGHNRIKEDVIEGVSGSLNFNAHTRKSAFKSVTGPVVEDLSSVELKHNDQSGIKLLAGGHVIVEAPHTISTRSRSYFESVAGDKQISISRDNHTEIGGKAVVTIGKITSETIKAAEELTQLASRITDTAISDAKIVKDTRIPCPNCKAVSLDDKKSDIAIKASRLMDLLSEAPWGAGYMRFVEMLKKVFSFLAPWLSIVKNSSKFSKTKSCGSPGCVNNTVSSLQKTIDKFGKTIDDQVKINEPIITDLSNKLGDDGRLTLIAKQGIVIQTGLSKNKPAVNFEKDHTIKMTGFRNAQNGASMAVSSQGSPPRLVHTPSPLSFTHADLTLNVGDKFTVHTGSGGVEMMSPGDVKITGAHVQIQSTNGELHIGSSNCIILNGKNVTLTGDDRSGDACINLKSPNIMAEGNFGVHKNLNVKGAVCMDGALWTPFISCLGAKQMVEESKPSQMATGHFQTIAGTIIRGAHASAQQILKNIGDPAWIACLDNLTSFIQEKYDIAMAAVFTILPDMTQLAGWTLVMTEGIGVGGCTLGGGVVTYVVSWGLGIVAPPLFCPTFLFYHNHSMFNMEHGGAVTVPLGDYYGETSSFYKARPVGSAIAMPAPTKGISGSRPGHISMMGGSCGGGGLYTRNRNSDIGLGDLDDPFNGQNFINRYVQLSGFDGFLPLPTDPNFSVYQYGIKPLSAADPCDTVEVRSCPSTQ